MPWDFKRKIIWLKNRHLVIGYYDVLDGGGIEPIQNYEIRIVDKDS